MKTLIVLSVLSALSINSIAQEVVLLPNLSNSSILNEGTERVLTSAQISELLPWAKDSKVFLIDLLEQVDGLPKSQKAERLVAGIEQVVIESAPQQAELLMRYSLNRALLINKILSSEMSNESVGFNDVKVRLLTQSIKFAIKYYDADIEKLSNKTTLPYAAFGQEYFLFLTELNKSIFDATAQYQTYRTALELLQFDLYRDLNNTTYANQILKINNGLKIYPKESASDELSINYLRQMKKLSEQLNFKVIKMDQTKSKTIIFNSLEVAKKKSNPKFVSVYSSYYGAHVCYPADRDGKAIGSSIVDIDNCAVGVASIYSSYYGANKCYQVDSEGNALNGGLVEDSKCFAGYKPFYSSYYGANLCYPVDTKGNQVGTKHVDVKYCQ